jgi:hypothetical protein
VDIEPETSLIVAIGLPSTDKAHIEIYRIHDRPMKYRSPLRVIRRGEILHPYGSYRDRADESVQEEQS